MTSSIETSESEALPWAPRGAAATAPAQPALETDAAPVVDKFKGDNAHLARCIQALLNLDARGALVPHGLGGHARDLLAAAACRLPLVSVRATIVPARNTGVLVPLKPTPEMLRAFDSNLDGLDDDGATRQWDKLMSIAALAQPAPVQAGAQHAAPSDMDQSDLEFALAALHAIAGNEEVVDGCIEKIVDIRRARPRAAEAYRRLARCEKVWASALAAPTQAATSPSEGAML